MIKKMYYQCPSEFCIMLGSGVRIVVDAVVLRLIFKSNLCKLAKVLSVGAFVTDTVEGFDNINNGISLMKALE